MDPKGGGSPLLTTTTTTMSEHHQQQRRASVPAPLLKQKSWSPDIHREEAWRKRKGNLRRRGSSNSLSDDDLDELRACFELGFAFDSPVLDPKLSKTFPALEFYHAVNRQFTHSLSRSSSLSDCESPSSQSSSSIIDPGDEPETVKTRLRQWAQVVACSVRQSSPQSL